MTPIVEDHPLLADDRTDEVGVIEVSVVMPCLNEAETLATCIRKAKTAFREADVIGEVVIADNGSTDGSQQIATQEGARVVAVSKKGYGNALMGGIEAARGKYILMGDADDSYEFRHLQRFIEKLRDGYELVMGDRFAGGIQPGAMPFLHRFFGNPVLSGIGRLFFQCPVHDFQCGLRAFTKDAYRRLELQTPGMEFASEMVVRATLLKLRIAEVPTTLAPDGRSRSPHLRTWRDGWRYLRFLLLYSPRWLFLYPGLMLTMVGLGVMLALIPGDLRIGRVEFSVHTMLFAAMAVLMGFQSLVFAIFAKILGVTQKLLPPDPRLDKIFKYAKLETGVIVGLTLMALGGFGALWSVAEWGAKHFGHLDPFQMLRLVIPSVLSMTLGVETVLASFFLALLGWVRR